MALCWGSIAIRSRSSRSRPASSTGRGTRAGSSPAAQGQDGQDRGGRRLRARRAGLRPATRPRRPLGHRLRARRPDRRPAPLRHPRLQDGEAAPRPSPRADGGRRGGLPPGTNIGVDVTARGASRPVRRHLPLRRRDPATRPADRRPRARGHPLRDGLPAVQNRQGGRRPDRRSRVHLGPGDATSSSSAAATPAPTAWAPSTASGAGASTSSRSSPAPRRPRPDQPLAPVVQRLPRLLGPRGGRRPGVSRSTPSGSWAMSTAASGRSRPSRSR